MYNVLLTLALRNAFVKRTRTLMLMLMIAASLSVMITLEALYDGMLTHMIKNSKAFVSGDVSLFTKGYYTSRAITQHIDNAVQVTKQIQTLLPDATIIRRLQSSGLAQTARKARDAVLIGVNFGDEEQFSALSTYIIAQQQTNQPVMIGRELARQLHLHLNDRLIFTTQSINGELSAMSLRISAIIQTSTMEIDQRGILVPQARVAQLLHMPNESATMIAVRSDNRAAYQKLYRAFSASLACKDFAALNPQLKQMQQMMGYFNLLTFAIVMSIVFIGIFGVIYISILERMREFGIMHAVGYAYRYIIIQLLGESLIIALGGYILGALLAAGMLQFLMHTGLDLSYFSAGLARFGMHSVIYADFSWSYFTHALYAIVLAALLSTVIAVRKLALKQIIHSIKEST